MYCVKETAKCAYGTPSTTKLSLVDRGKALYKMTIEKYNVAVGDKSFEAKTSNELILLAKALIASQVCDAATHTGTWPNCVPIPPPPPKVCEVPNTGNYPDCGQCLEPFEGVYPACKRKTCTAPKVGTYPDCKDPAPPPTTSLMPSVDVAKNIKPAVGYSDLRVRLTTEKPENRDGNFRISCVVSHMNNDDPLVYPNQEGRAHHHTFYGNTNVKYDTDLSKITTTGNSTCDGGIMNRSAYWHPTMIQSLDKSPVLADQGAIFYYKHGALPATSIKSPPKGLRMIAGNMKAKTAAEAKSTIFWCINIKLQHSNGMPKMKTIPACGTDSFLQMITTFPQCWDGNNLDSPNHQDHMAYPVENKCPASHPVPIPEISLNLNYKVRYNGETATWRLSSDNYTYDGKNAGYSGHADWVNGWDQTFLDGIVKNCLNAVKDCHAHLLGDGRMFYRD
jgi:hypothetical protein